MFDLDDKKIRVKNYKLSSQSFSKNVFTCKNIKLCVVMQGSALWKIDERIMSVKCGDLVILNNRMKRMFHEVSEEGIELLIVEFEPQVLMNQYRGILYEKCIERNNVISDQLGIIRLFQEMEIEARRKQNYSNVIIAAKLVEVLALVMRYYDITEGSNIVLDDDMYHVLDFIDANYTKEISLQSVAELLHMTTTGFSRFFKKSTGIRFSDYVMQKRIQQAIHLLKTSEKTVLEIALECGYNNSANFYKAFKKITELSPSDYRNVDKNTIMI